MTKLHTKNKMTSRRAVAPVIATLLLVAIAVVGGSIIFVFSQGFFSSAQISGNPNIESIKILGYDATDGPELIYHDGVTAQTVEFAGNATSDGLATGEYVAVYLKNDSVNKVTFSEIRLAGEVYIYNDMNGLALTAYTETCPGTSGDGQVDCGEYTIVAEGDTGTILGATIQSSAPELQPGQEGTMVLALDKDIKIGRDMQFKLSTSNGAVFVGTINTGQQSG